MGFANKLRGLFQGSKTDLNERFEILREAVSGTMSKFYKAHDRKLDRVVGLKICDDEKTTFFENRFKGLSKPSEGEIAIQFDHPKIVKTLEFGVSTTGAHFLVMDYLDGPGINVCINRQVESFMADRLSVIRDMAEALQVVHDAEFIHRDVCPRNFIFLDDQGCTKLIDFGLTVPATKHFMQPGNRTGTPNYMAPEIIRRKATDRRLDLFAFGVTVFQCLTLELPWPGQDVTGKAAVSHDTQPPTDIFKLRPNLDKTLGDAVTACLQRNPDDRPSSFSDFLQRISDVAAENAA